MKIVVTRRPGDYHACLEGHSEIWGAGKTPSEAIGNVLYGHTDTFSVKKEGGRIFVDLTPTFQDD